MTPPLWQFAILTLAAFRVTRLLGWDTFPLAVRFRAWLTGEVPQHDIPNDDEPTYERDWVAHLLACPFCLGAWVSLATCVCWWSSGSPGGRNLGWFGWVAFPFALSGAVGLISKQLDA